MANDPKSIFTIDVEDYFHVTEERGEPPVSTWDGLPSIVEKGFNTLLDLLDQYQVKATCFFLGYIANRFPHLVREAQKRGHEIGSHGMYHSIIYKMSRDEFYHDCLNSKQILEDISGEKVECFRSPSFSFTTSTPWFYEVLAQIGFVSDSSLFPVKRDFGGFATDNIKPHWITTESGTICEFPISVVPLFGKDICFFGGGYLRLFPLKVILHMHRKLTRQGIPTMFYIHPREIYPLHPRLKMNWSNYFKAYVNMRSVQSKLEAILQSSSFVTCHEYMNMEMKER